MPGTGEDVRGARARRTTRRGPGSSAGCYNAIGERFNDEMGFVPRRGVNNALLFVGRAFRPEWLSQLGIREMRPHWQMDMFTRRDGVGLESRYQDFHLPFNFHDGGFLEIGVNPNVEEIRVPFTINSARGVRVDPGPLRVQRVVLPLEHQQRRAVSRSTAAIRSASSTTATGAATPSVRALRVNEHFNASVNLQVNDIELSTGVVRLDAGDRAASTTTSTRRCSSTRCCSTTPTRGS